MSLNLSRDHDSSLYTSDRIIQLMANGSMVLSKTIPGIDKIIKSNEVVFFENKKDCIEKIEYYYHNDRERMEIAVNGWKKAHSSYNSTRITKYMINLIFNGKNEEDYEWKDEILV